MSCFICGSDADRTCSGCVEDTSFCSNFYHESMHRLDGSCLPYVVVIRPGVGRCVIATRDISAGELVLADFSVAAGPKEYGTPARCCVICLAPVSSSAMPCACGGCGLELCGKRSCILKHEDEECAAAFSKWIRDRQQVGDSKEDLRLGCAAPYRLAKRRLRDPDLDKHLALLMEHQNERAADPDHAKRCSDAVELICGTDEEIPAPLVKSCLGLLRINAMGVGGGRGRALFPVFSFLSHSCANNCRHVSEYDADMGHFKVRLYAQVPIQKGDELTITYTNLLRGAAERRARLQHQWYFTCACQRCQDPGSDFGTFINLVRCPKCAADDDDGGYLTLSKEFIWSCSSCQLSVSGASVEGLVGQFLDALEGIQAGSRTAIEEYENFIATAADHLHKNHFTCLIAKRYLSQLYDVNEAADSKRIVEICRDLLAVFDILDPGLSQTRGLTMSQLVLAKLGQSEGEELRTQVDLVTRCLEFEPADSISYRTLARFRSKIKAKLTAHSEAL